MLFSSSGSQDPVSSLLLSRTSPTSSSPHLPTHQPAMPYPKRLTIRSYQHGPKYEDDGGISSHEEPEPEGSDDKDEDPNPNAHPNVPPLPLSQMYDHPLHTPIQTPVLAPTPPAPMVHPAHAPTPIFPSPPIQTPPSPSSAGSPSRARLPPPSHHDRPHPNHLKLNRAAGSPGSAGISMIL